MTWRTSYGNEYFLRLVNEGKLVPPELPKTLHLHWMLVRGRTRWVSSLRKSDACGTVRCKVITITDEDVKPPLREGYRESR